MKTGRLAVSVASLALWAGSAAHTSAVRAREVAPAPQTPSIGAGALISQYCATCHSTRAHVGGLVLESQDPARADQAPELWEKVVRKLRAGVMPPVGQPRPDAATYDALASAIEGTL